MLPLSFFVKSNPPDDYYLEDMPIIIQFHVYEDMYFVNGINKEHEHDDEEVYSIENLDILYR